MEINNSLILGSAKDWLSVFVFISFVSYSYYCLVLLLIHNYKSDRLKQNIDAENG